MEQGSGNYYGFPREEFSKIFDALKKAAEANDIEALKWTVTLLEWLFDDTICEAYDSCMLENAEDFFNRTWEEMIERNPPPAIIAGIITPPEPEPEHWSNCWKEEIDDDPSLNFENGPPLVKDRADAMALIDAMMGTTISDLDNGLLAIRKVIEVETEK